MHVTRRRFEQLVADALDALPDDLTEHAENVAVIVEDWPDGELAQRGALLGLYQGVALTERSPLDTFRMPDRITLFRGPLAAMCGDEDELFEQIRVTLVHEFAHHFGIDDDRLDELGWG